MSKRISAAALSAAPLLALTTAPAFAHVDPLAHGAMASGLLHPFSGTDHMLAMIAVGLWAAQLGGKARFAVPASFVMVMAVGFVLALTGASLPFVEPAILASVVGLGLLVALAVKLPTMLGMVVVGAFALFHGYAHGAELGGADALIFGLGFVAATAMLHAIGLGLGVWASSRSAVIGRLLGALTAVGGAALMFG
ncbi:HupE/UreJ family protein [Rhizobium sp. G21]|uniref:HupE/UreJ family protein n=1 Tax=Rhizobium sp. G21 TaxID=2758439 RepID=UPI0015FF747D|nr:HupE/UreJ family protein [Rhizobium sp. G21]MBB1250404.1 HupE/UreJ family protein [Rhizobium sp. G21]